MKPEGHYFYPNQAAEFGRYNFHRPGTIDKLAGILTSGGPASPKIVELVGAKGSGRHYLLRAAAFEPAAVARPPP